MAGMNLMGYDAMAVGPKELSLGLEVLQKRMSEAQFPMLSANAVISKTGELLAPPYTVLEVGGHRLAVIGLTRTPDQAISGVSVMDPEAALTKTLADLGTQAETVILLTNVPYQTAQAMAAAVPGIDLIIAALPQFIPAQVVSVPGTKTMVVSAELATLKHSGRRVGRLAVTVEGDGSLSQPAWQTDAMGPNIIDDPQMRDLLSSYSR